MKRRTFIATLAQGVLAASPLPPGTARRPGTRFVERWSWAMGQAVHLRLFSDSEWRGEDAAAAALAELRRVDARLSLFDDTSDLAELNRHAGRGPMRAGADLARVLALCAHFRRRTGGAFDPAVEPLMRVWGFREPRAAPPTARELAEAAAAVRAGRIAMDGERVSLPSAHARLDFGGIGVGYGLDRAAAVLHARGIASALVEVSGDFFAIGTPPGERGWRIGIADPRRPGQIRAERVLRDAALATSSNAGSVIRYGSLLVGHVLDPATGRPAGAARQATVIATTAAVADALATAALVIGAAAVAREPLTLL